MSSTSRKNKPLSSEPSDAVNQGARKSKRPKPAIPVWEGKEYARIAPGRYTAAAVRVIAPVYLGLWQRASLGICFCPFSEPDAEVVLFFNLGAGEIKRGSYFYRDWTRANGGPPMNGQKMDPAIFLEGQTYEIEVCDANTDSDGNRKSDAEVYSKVKRIVSVQRTGDIPVGVVSFKGRD